MCDVFLSKMNLFVSFIRFNLCSYQKYWIGIKIEMSTRQNSRKSINQTGFYSKKKKILKSFHVLILSLYSFELLLF